MVEIKADIKSKVERENLFLELYKKAFPQAARYIKNLGGNLEETKDVFQDALVIYYEKLMDGHITLQNKNAYLLGIAKNLWIQKYRKDKGKLSLEEIAENINTTNEPEVKPYNDLLIRFLEKSGKKCLNMLQAFYYQKMSLLEISSHFGYSSVRSATVQKYKCLEKVRDNIKEKSLNYEDFLE